MRSGLVLGGVLLGLLLGGLVTPGVAQSEPALVITASPENPAPGTPVSLSLDLVNVTDVFGLQVRCQVNPAVLAGTAATGADGFNDSNSYLIDAGFNAADGSWLVAASRLQPNPAVSGTVTAFILNYQVLAAGDSQLSCEALAVNSRGQALPLTVVVDNVASPPPTSTPTIEPSPTTPPESTPEPSPMPAAGTISGTVQYQNRADNAGISAQLYDLDGALLAEMITLADGAYRFEAVAAGEYRLVLAATQHIPVVYALALTDAQPNLTPDPALLPAGDVDDNGVVDILDATLIGANLGLLVPPAPANTDLNQDAQTDISDLALMGSNFGIVSPLHGSVD